MNSTGWGIGSGCLWREGKGSFETMLSILRVSQGALVANNLPASAGDVRDADLIPGLGRSTGESHGNPLQYPCLEDPMDRGAWRAVVHRVASSQTRLKWLHARGQVCVTVLGWWTHSSTFVKTHRAILSIEWNLIYTNLKELARSTGESQEWTHC